MLPLNVVDQPVMCDPSTCLMRCAILAGGLVVPGGCAVNEQAPLAVEMGPQTAHRSLVVSPLASGSPSLNVRNDASMNVKSNQTPYLYGPGGRLLYDDGSPVEFKTLREQLRDLKAEDR